MNKIIDYLRKPITLFRFSLVVSIATLVLYNIPFFNYVAHNNNESLGGQILLLTSLGVLMVALDFTVTYLMVYLMRIVGRILLAIGAALFVAGLGALCGAHALRAIAGA